MRQDVLIARRRLSALLLTVSAWRPGKLQLEWRELITKPAVIAAAAIFILVCGSLLMTQDRLDYAVVYGGKEIGVVTSRQIGDALSLQVQQGLERQWGKTVFLPAPLTYMACRAPDTILSPPGELAESIRDLPWITDGGPVFINQEPVLVAQGMPRMVAYGSVTRDSDSGTLALQRELRDQEEEAKIAAKNGPVKSMGGIASINHPVTVGSAGIASMFSYAESYIGTHYVWGGTTPNPGFDCSGFTQHVFHHLGINLRRTSQEQYLEGAPITESNLQPGDLVFFITYTYGASHVGIYIGSGRMVDSEVSGVIIDNITNSYWAPRYLGARRIAQS
jgi:cell wall-associated NlpC family hydrolase